MASGLPLVPSPDSDALTEIPETDVDSIHVIQWERDIVWGDSDDCEAPAAKLRGDSQNGATGQADADDWDDLDRALEMDVDFPMKRRDERYMPAPLLEPLPQRPVTGTWCFSPAHCVFTNFCTHMCWKCLIAGLAQYMFACVWLQSAVRWLPASSLDGTSQTVPADAFSTRLSWPTCFTTCTNSFLFFTEPTN